MRSNQIDDFYDKVDCLSQSVEDYKQSKVKVGKLHLGVVAVDPVTHKPGSGSYYSAGAKVYKSEAVARAAVKEKMKRGYEYVFLDAYCDMEVGSE